MKTAYFVLGMHRSGTSALTGVLQNLGLELGSNLMQATEMNFKGYFENVLIFNLNEKIFNEQRSSWDSPQFNLNLIPDKKKSSYIDEIKELILKEFNKVNKFVIKDPRICILFPLWEHACNDLGLKIKVVMPYRNPFEVYKSLNKRNHFTFEKSIILWANHILNAELYSRPYDRLFISFDELLNQTKKSLESLGLFFDLQVDQDNYIKIASFLDKSAKHYNNSYEDISSNIPTFLHEIIILFKNKAFNDQKLIDKLRLDFISSIGLFYNKEMQVKLESEKDLSSELTKLRYELTLLERIVDISALDDEYYFSQNSDLINYKGSLQDHYYNHGKKEGRLPNKYCEHFKIESKNSMSKGESLYFKDMQINEKNQALKLSQEELNIQTQKLIKAKNEILEINKRHDVLLQTHDRVIEVLKEEEKEGKKIFELHKKNLIEINKLNIKKSKLELINKHLGEKFKSQELQLEANNQNINKLLNQQDNLYQLQLENKKELHGSKQIINKLKNTVKENNNIIDNKNELIKELQNQKTLLEQTLDLKRINIKELEISYEKQRQELVNDIELKTNNIKELKHHFSQVQDQLLQFKSLEKKSSDELKIKTQDLLKLSSELKFNQQKLIVTENALIEENSNLKLKEAEIDKLKTQIDEIIIDLIEIKESKYWKFSIPFRTLISIIKDKK